MRAPTARARKAIRVFGQGLFTRRAELRAHFGSFRHLRTTLGLGYVAASRVQSWARVPEPDDPSRHAREQCAALASTMLALEASRRDGLILGWRVTTGPTKCVCELLCPSHKLIQGEAPSITRAVLVAVQKLGEVLYPARGEA